MKTETRIHVHALVEQLPPSQLEAVEALLQSMLHPWSRKLALAPMDDEPFTVEERQAVADADEWRKHHDPIPLDDVLADLGLTQADWVTMSEGPLAPQHDRRNG